MDKKLAEIQAEEALDTANSASSIARALYLSFMALTAYIAVNLLSTDDAQLLLYTPLKLPLLSVSIDLKGFYSLVPWLYLIVHINLLLVFSVLAQKLHHFESRVDLLDYPKRQNMRKRLHVFGLTQTISARNTGLLSGMLNFTLWVTASLVPVSLLLWIQLDFLPAQEQGVIWLQRWAIFLDCVITSYFWLVIMQDRRKQLMPKNWRPSWIRKFTLGGNFLIGYYFIVFFIAFFVAMVPLGSWERLTNSTFFNPGCPNDISTIHWKDVVDEKSQMEFTKAINLAMRNVDTNHSSLKLESIENMFSVASDMVKFDSIHGPGYKNLIKETTVVKRDCIFRSTYWLSDRKDAWFPRSLKDTNNQFFTSNRMKAIDVNRLKKWNIDETEKNNFNNNKAKRTSDNPLDYVLELNLNGRSFRFANFYQTILPKVNLEKAQLQGANLSQAHLQGANLYQAQLQGAILINTHFQGAQLVHAQLQKTKLHHVQLKKAKLMKAQLQEAHIYHGNLDAADFTDTNLIGINIEYSSMQKTIFSGAIFHGAKLSNNSLQEAFLDSASFRGATLINNSLQEAILFKTNLEGTLLSENKWHGSMVKNVYIDRAFIYAPKHQYKYFKKNKSITYLKYLQDITSGIFNSNNLNEIFNIFDGRAMLLNVKSNCLIVKKLCLSHFSLCKEVDQSSVIQEFLIRKHLQEWSEWIALLVCSEEYPEPILRGVSTTASYLDSMFNDNSFSYSNTLLLSLKAHIKKESMNCKPESEISDLLGIKNNNDRTARHRKRNRKVNGIQETSELTLVK